MSEAENGALFVFDVVGGCHRNVGVAQQSQWQPLAHGEHVFLDVTDSPERGLPDGLKVDQRGSLWASGPGGVLIISPDGKHLGTLATGVALANCAWGEDGSGARANASVETITPASEVALFKAQPASGALG